MAIKIANNQGLYRESAVVDAFPFSMACKFRVRTDWDNYPLVWVGDKDSATYHCNLQARGGNGGDPFRLFVAEHEIANSRAASSGTYTPLLWHHGLGVAAGTTSRIAYLDGSAGTEETDASGSPAGYNRTALGALMDSTPVYKNWTELAEVAIWSRALEGWEAADLAAGYSPLFFIEDLVAYWPLGGEYGENYLDVVGGNDLSEWDDSALEWVDHPEGIRYPVGPFEKAYQENLLEDAWR